MMAQLSQQASAKQPLRFEWTDKQDWTETIA